VQTLSTEEVKKLVDEVVYGELTMQVENGLQSSQDELGGVGLFSMAITDRVEPQDRTSRSRSPTLSSDDEPYVPDQPTPRPPPRKKNPKRGRVGGSYLPTPAELRGRKGLINIKNHHDHECFKYAICAAVHPTALTKYTRHTAKNWRVHFDEFDWGNLQFPLHVNDISMFEDLNPTLAVNVLSWDSERMVHARERATKHQDRRTLWLMLIHDSGLSHYITIKEPQTFLSHGRLCKKFYCPTCWKQFSSKTPFETHLKNGCQVHGDHPTDAVPAFDRGIQFNDWDNKKKTPQHTKYYADFETCTVPLIPSEDSSTKLLGRLDPMSYNIRRRRETGVEGPVWKAPIHYIKPSGMSRHQFVSHFWADLLAAVLEDYNEIRTVEPLVILKSSELL